MTDTTTLPADGNRDEDEDVRGPDTPGEDVAERDTPAEGDDAESTPDEPDTFPREYVQQLRKEAGDARAKAKDRDELAHRLHTAMVAATGRLADPEDLPFDEDHIADAAKMATAIDELLARKPHMASRTPRGDVGQGAAGGADDFSLAGILRTGAA